MAEGRVVDSNTRELEYYLPHVASVADSGTHTLLVTSPFLDEHVNDARNGVSFSDDGENPLLGVSAAAFKEALSESVSKRLGIRQEEALNSFKQRVEEVVSKNAPYFRPMLLSFFSQKEFRSLSSSSRDEEILSALDAYKRRDALNLRRDSKRIAKLHDDSNAYWQQARDLSERVELQKKVTLAEYVSLRKVILDQLEHLLEIKEDGKAHREEAIHNLIFPQRTDTESSPGVDHQLWLIDERLESHRYLASDKPIDGHVGDRPDLLIALDSPGAFGSDPSATARGYDRIVLVEFKRALLPLDKVPTDDLPHRQMMRYAAQIEDERAKHLATGRTIKVSKDVRFYGYAICELSEDLLNRLKKHEQFTLSPTSDGAFAVFNEGRYYMEYISFEKLLEDANARNSAFFRRLGLE